jgi:hypothetical protein
MRRDTSELEIDMKVEELIGSAVWIKTDHFRSVLGQIQIVSIYVTLYRSPYRSELI